MDTGPKYARVKCVQLTNKKTLYKDVNDEPIETPIEVTFNAGCELRCIEKDCGNPLFKRMAGKTKSTTSTTTKRSLTRSSRSTDLGAFVETK